MVVRARRDSGEGGEVAIKLLEDFSEHKYTLIKVLRELSVLEYVAQLQASDGLPPIFSGVLDVFTP